jgi:hypothetical protein
MIFGFGFSQRFRNFRAETVDSSADGGRYARIDRLIDDDGPLRKTSDIPMELAPTAAPAPEGLSKFLYDHPEDHKSTRKHFIVSTESIQGGMGLHQGYREPKREKKE